jgi:Ca2+-binding EF-hand superfamily protein
MQYVLLSMLIGALFGGGMAIAQSSSEIKQPRPISKFSEQFKTADKDGDGALTRSEAQTANLSRVVEHFDRIDANHDGKVTRDEIRALVRARVSI